MLLGYSCIKENLPCFFILEHLFTMKLISRTDANVNKLLSTCLAVVVPLVLA